MCGQCARILWLCLQTALQYNNRIHVNKGAFLLEEKGLACVLEAVRHCSDEIGSRFGVRVTGYRQIDPGVILVCEDLRPAVTFADMNGAEQTLRRACKPCRIDLMNEQAAVRIGCSFVLWSVGS